MVTCVHICSCAGSLAKMGHLCDIGYLYGSPYRVTGLHGYPDGQSPGPAGSRPLQELQNANQYGAQSHGLPPRYLPPHNPASCTGRGGVPYGHQPLVGTCSMTPKSNHCGWTGRLTANHNLPQFCKKTERYYNIYDVV